MVVLRAVIGELHLAENVALVRDRFEGVGNADDVAPNVVDLSHYGGDVGSFGDAYLPFAMGSLHAGQGDVAVLVVLKGKDKLRKGKVKALLFCLAEVKKRE